MKKVYRVVKSRLTYDLFEVSAQSPEEAARLVARGKVSEKEIGCDPQADTIFDVPEEIKVLGDEREAGYWNVLFKRDASDL